MFGQFQETALQLFNGHVLRAEIDVEQRAKLPRAVADDPAFAIQPFVERRAGKRGHERHLHLVKSGVPHEVQHVVEHFRRVAVETEDETAVDGSVAA